MKKYLLFDLDGTLTDPMIGITSCVQYALQAFGIEEPDLQKLTPFIGPPLRESFMKFYGFDEQQAESAVAKYRERFQDIGIFENEVYAGIPRMLRTLQSKGMFLAVASSKPQVYVERILEHFDLKKYFKVVVGSELDGTRERKDEVVLEALNRLFAYKPIQKNQVYMIGDRSYDVAGARAIGVESVGVTYGFGDIEELKEAKADYIVRSVEELEKFLLRGVEETQPADQKKGLTFADIWVMLYAFLLFMAVRSIVMYVVDLLCIQLWGAQLPPAIDRLLFDRNAELPEGVELAFAADQIVIKSALGFVGGALAIRREAAKWIAKTAEDTKLNHLRKDGADSVLLFAGASAGTALGLNLLLELLGLTAQSNVYQAVRTEQYAASFLIGLLTYGLIAPVAEELLFRGVIHNYLRRLFAPKQALFISAALFGVYHMNYVQGIYGFLLGGLIAYGYEYFGKFRAALLMHAGVNLLVYSISYAAGRDNAAWLVNWPVCLVMAALAGGCLWAISRKKNVW